VGVRRVSDLERGFAAIVKERAGALLPAALLGRIYRRQLLDFMVQQRLPAISDDRRFVEAGALMGYGPDSKDYWRRAATYVDIKILKGVKPADRPDEQPAKFALVINLRTAKALGLSVPPAVLARPDAIIQ
jgi:putative ABC transport system substrate-binding protein